MLRRGSWTKVVVMMLMVRGMQMEVPTVEEAQSRYLKQWLLSTKAAALDELTKSPTRTVANGARAGRSRVKPDSPDKRDNILEVITALEELHRAVNGTLGARITMRPRANGRNSGKKNKAKASQLTTLAPAAAAAESTRASADVEVPSLTGRNLRKSLAPQAKKANKRVCFWKYCSQN